MNKEGELLNEIPHFVNIKKIPDLTELLNGKCTKRLRWVFYNRNIIEGAKFLLALFFHKINHNRGTYYRRLINFLSDIRDQYDYVVSYTMPDSICVPYVAEKMHGKYKWMWCHIDVNFYKGHELDGMEVFFQKFDRIVNVSSDAKKAFEIKYPQVARKSCLIHNYLDAQNIVRLSLEPCNEMDEKVIKFLTVGRITYQKGQDIAIEVAKKMVSRKIQFKWYFLGPKSDAAYFISFIQRIKEENLEDKLIYLGQTDNPYKYMKKCDIYIQPSRFEGYCTTVTEAQILKKPVIMTDVAGAREQIKDGITGIITPASSDDIANNLERLVYDKDFREELAQNLDNDGLSIDKYEEVIQTLKI